MDDLRCQRSCTRTILDWKSNLSNFLTYDDSSQDVCEDRQNTICGSRKSGLGNEIMLTNSLRLLQPKPDNTPKLEHFLFETNERQASCCHQRATILKRPFICNFSTTIATNECAAVENSRCKAFWKLVDERPELMGLMRTGEFEHISLPQLLEPRKGEVSQRCKDAEALRAKNKAFHDAQRQRALKRRKMLEELQKKSGQPAGVRRDEIAQLSSPIKDDLAPFELTDFSKLVDEMDEFDLRSGALSTKPFCIGNEDEDCEGDTTEEESAEEDQLEDGELLGEGAGDV